MKSRNRLLLVESTDSDTHVVVSEDERILIDEQVKHTTGEIMIRKEDVLGALHTMGMNLTKLSAVVSFTTISSAGSRELAHLISEQLNISVLHMGEYHTEHNVADVIRASLKLLSHENM